MNTDEHRNKSTRRLKMSVKHRLFRCCGILLSLICVYLCSSVANSAESPRIKVLFLGDNGHHKPIERAADLLAPLARAGVDLAYTDDLQDLNKENLARYDGLIIYANHTKISPEQEAALLGY